MAHAQTTTTETRSPDYIAWNVVKRGDNAHWTKIGAAWQHRDGKGMNLHLEAMPFDGRITLREPKADPEREGGGA